MEQIEIFYLDIDREEEESGVDFIALVDDPAIQSNWQAFKSVKDRFAIQDEEKRIVSGYAMIADLPIVRVDEKGEKFYVAFKGDVIKKIAFKYFEDQNTTNVNEMHDSSKIVEGVFLFESLLIDSERGIKAPDTFEDAPDGSWWVSMRVENDDVWEKIKAGQFQGFSVEGFFTQREPQTTDQKVIDQITEIVKNHANNGKVN